jgi:AGZA family xanthine/uracil permease-like MFS transporter
MDKTALLSLLGFVLMIFFLKRKNPFAFLIGIGAVTLIALTQGLVVFPEHPFSFPDFHSHFFKLDIWGALKLSLVPAIIAICFTDFFDSVSTFVGVSQATGMLDSKGDPTNLKQGLIVDSLATLFAGLFGSSSGTAFIESTAGIEAGGRTGTSAVVTALCFLPCFFLAPLAAMVPSYATAPVLMIVGALMFRQVVDLPLKAWEDLIPIFLTIVLIPLTFSITQGMLWGFISHVVLYVMAGRRKEVDPIMYFVAALSVVLLSLEHS